MNKVVVIGAGASGLVSSIFASNKNNVILLEKNANCGKKLLLTGNGRCNFFNNKFNIDNYYCDDTSILEKLITEDNADKVLTFFNKIGIIPKERDGYLYPFTNQAVTIQNALIMKAKSCNVDIRNNMNVKDIKYQDNMYYIYVNDEVIIADKVIISTGSKSYSNTGSDGFGYDLLKKMNHTVNPVLPALTSLVGEDNFYKDWVSIRTDAIISLYENDKYVSEEKGELQLTSYGISGICVFNLSRIISKGLFDKKKENIHINFMPYLNNESIEEMILEFNERNNMFKNANLVELFEGMLNYKLVKVILKRIKINENNNWNDLSYKDKELICKNFTDFNINIVDVKSFENAQVCLGGIPLNEVNIETMESIKQKGLYITGELLDVDGKCGGYNLAFAWITGMIAGENI